MLILRFPDLEFDCEIKDELFNRYVREDFLEGQTRGIPPPAVVTLDGYGKVGRLAKAYDKAQHQ